MCVENYFIENSYVNKRVLDFLQLNDRIIQRKIVYLSKINSKAQLFKNIFQLNKRYIKQQNIKVY